MNTYDGGYLDEQKVESAIKMILETERVSTAFLQRRLRIGYAEAANIIDLLTVSGVIEPLMSHMPRKVLVKDYDIAVTLAIEKYDRDTTDDY